MKQLVKLRDRRPRDETGVFLVEGYREIRRALEKYEEIDFDIALLPSTKGLIRLLEKTAVDLLLLDYSLPGRSGRRERVAQHDRVIDAAQIAVFRFKSKIFRAGKFALIQKQLHGRIIGLGRREKIQSRNVERAESAFQSNF